MVSNAFLLTGCRRPSIDHGRASELFIIESSACRLVMRKVRLPKRVAEIVVLVWAIENGPDVTIEPRLVSRVPAHGTGAPVNQRSGVSRGDLLRVAECAGRAIEIRAFSELADGHVFDDIIHGHYVENFRNVSRIGAH